MLNVLTGTVSLSKLSFFLSTAVCPINFKPGRCALHLSKCNLRLCHSLCLWAFHSGLLCVFLQCCSLVFLPPLSTEAIYVHHSEPHLLRYHCSRHLAKSWSLSARCGRNTLGRTFSVFFHSLVFLLFCGLKQKKNGFYSMNWI